LRLLCVLGGVGSEAVDAERFRTLWLGRGTSPGNISIARFTILESESRVERRDDSGSKERIN